MVLRKRVTTLHLDATSIRSCNRMSLLAAAALLIVIVLLLNLIGRIVAKVFAVKTER